MTLFSARLPERSLAIGLLRRGALIWFAARLMLMALGAVLPGRKGLSLSATTAFALVLVVAALGLLEARRRNEHRFLANLGVSPIIIVLLSMIPALVGELVLGLAGPR